MVQCTLHKWYGDKCGHWDAASKLTTTQHPGTGGVCPPNVLVQCGLVVEATVYTTVHILRSRPYVDNRKISPQLCPSPPAIGAHTKTPVPYNIWQSLSCNYPCVAEWRHSFYFLPKFDLQEIFICANWEFKGGRIFTKLTLKLNQVRFNVCKRPVMDPLIAPLCGFPQRRSKHFSQCT